MTCRCASCVIRSLAIGALEVDKPEIVASPDVRAAAVELLEAKRDNLLAESETCLDFARQDDRLGFDVRAAMFRGAAFRARELADDEGLRLARWRAIGAPT